VLDCFSERATALYQGMRDHSKAKDASDDFRFPVPPDTIADAARREIIADSVSATTRSRSHMIGMPAGTDRAAADVTPTTCLAQNFFTLSRRQRAARV